ncbi:MAG: adenylate/guanylate cyclase domain-containing protein [Betaproteobacteria bacterium]
MPQTRYVDAHGVSVAYQVFGAGARDLVMVPGIVSHLETGWEWPRLVRVMRQLAGAFRVIVFDKRGQGMSDSIEGVPTLEQRMDDVHAVMEAAGSRKAVLLAMSEGGAMAALFTATYPELVERLVLFASMARFTWAPDYPFSPTLAQHLKAVDRTWGTAQAGLGFAPSLSHEPHSYEFFARLARRTASPSAIKRLMMANDQIDVRAVLPQIRRPTLIMHRRGDRIVHCANGRYLADHITDATYLELPGADHVLPSDDADEVVAAVCRFAGADTAVETRRHADRWLATVLFTDIVGSTSMAERMGDRNWGALLQQFHAVGQRQLERHRGELVDTAGDGMFAVFDGPARAIHCASAITREVRDLGIDLRAGVHTGEVESAGDKVSGVAVHIGARVMAHAGSSEIIVSSTTKDLVAGSGLDFADRGLHALKGVSGEWRLFQVLTD